MSERATPRTAVVTGGNSGVGFEIAKGLGRKGYRVWIAARRLDKGAEAVAKLRPDCPAGIDFLPLDVGLFARVEEFIRALKPQLGGRLDVLVNSTGANYTTRTVSADGLEMGWATHVVGRYLITEALTPELSKSDDGRVIFVGAMAPKQTKINEDDLTLEKKYSIIASIMQAQSGEVLYQQLYAMEHPNGPTINGATTGTVRDTDIVRGLSGFDRIYMSFSRATRGITSVQSAVPFIALATDPALKGLSGYFYEKPGSLEKRVKLAYSKEELDSMRRVLSRYEKVKNALLAI